MDGYTVHGGIGMTRGTTARIEDGRGILVYVWDGELWLTQEGDQRDHFVRPGRWFRIERDGVCMLHAVRRSHVTLTAPVPTHYARRVSVMAAGSGVPRILYDRGGERGGWLRGLRQRFARRWNSGSEYDLASR
jgi:hypothetical protein